MSMDAAVIDTGGGSGGGGILDTVKAHPIIAAAVVGGALGLFVLIRRQSGGAGASNGAAAAPSGGQLSPSANIALGQIAYDVTQGFGQASIAAAQNAATTQSNFDAISNMLNGIGANVSTVSGQVAGVGAQIQNNQAETDRNFQFISRQVAGQDPTQISVDPNLYGPPLSAGDYAVPLVSYANPNTSTDVANPNSLSAQNAHLNATVDQAA